MDVETKANHVDRGDGAENGRDDAPLPAGYGSDRLSLMVRDPESALAYWDLSTDRVKVIGPGGEDRARLRLIGVQTGYLLAEHTVSAPRGTQALALPEPDRSYLVELAVMRDYRWVVLARSNVIHAPPRAPRPASTPAFVNRAQRVRLLSERSQPEPEGAGEERVAGPGGVSDLPSPRGRVQVGSEARLLPAAAQASWTHPRSGSEARLARWPPAHMEFVIAGRPGTPAPVDAAVGALAAAVWLAGDPAAVLSAGARLISALAGVSAGPVVAILDRPGPEVAPADAVGPDASAGGADGYTVSESPDGSITVVGSDGSWITYSPARSAEGRAGSAAAIVGVRDAY